MTKCIVALLALMIVAGTGSLSVAEQDNVTCALNSSYDCYPGEGCEEWSIDGMALPRFVNIDFKNKTITSLDKEIKRNSKIASVERLEHMVVLHGTELRGWTIAYGEDTGNLTLSASGDGEGFVVFGTCMEK